MDFAQPDTAGVGPGDPALLRARGADPLIEIPSNHFLRSVSGINFQPVPGALTSTPNALPYSVVESILGPILAVDRAAAGGCHAMPVFSSAILPAKFEAALTQSFLEAPNVRLDPNARYANLSAAAAAVVEFTGRLDASLLHPAYVLTPADVYLTEPVQGSSPAAYRLLFSAGTAVSYDSVANDAGFLTQMGFLGFAMFGRALAASRDSAASPTRSAISQIETMAMAADLVRAGANLTASSLRHWLDLTMLPSGLAYLAEVGTGTDRREQCVRDRHLLLYGDVSQKESILAGIALTEPMRSRLPNISQVLGKGCLIVDARVSILRLIRGVLGSHAADMASIAMLENLEPALKNLVPSLTMPSLVGASLSKRVEAVIQAAGDTSAVVSGAASGVTAVGGGATGSNVDRAKADLFSDELAGAMGQVGWRAVEAQLTAELLLPNPSSLKMHDCIINSPLLGARRLALGSKDAALSAVLKLSKPLTRALLELEDFRAVASLMLVCDLTTMSTSEPNLISFRLAEKTASALKRGAFDEIDWVADVLVAVMRARDPNVTTDQFSHGLYDPRVAPQLEPLMRRVSRLLGLPTQPPPPIAAAAVLGVAAPPAAPFTSLSQIVATVADENLDITGHPSPFDEDYLAKLRLFESTAWSEAATEFKQRVASSKNPAGPTLISVLPPTSAAKGILAVMRTTKLQNRAAANSNPTTYAMLAEYRAGTLGGRYHSQASNSAHVRDGGDLNDRSRSRSPGAARAAPTRDRSSRPSNLTAPGSRVDNTLGFAADGSAFWYTSPDTRNRVSPVYDYETLEQIAGRTRDQLDFPVLLSTMPPHKRMSLCDHHHLRHHQTLGSSAHQVPFADFLDLVRQRFQMPTTQRSPVVGFYDEGHGQQGLDDSRLRGGQHYGLRDLPRGKSPNPDDAKRSHRRPVQSAPRARSQPELVIKTSRSASPATAAARHDARQPPRSRSRSRSRSPARQPDNPGDGPVQAAAGHTQTTDASTSAQAGSAAPPRRPPDRRDSPTASRTRGGASRAQGAKWMLGLVAPGKSDGAPTSTEHPHPRAPPLINLLAPTHAMVRTILLVVALASDSPMRLLVPPNHDEVIGVTSARAATRAAAVATAQILASALALPGVDPAAQCVPIAESMPALADLVQTVDRVVALPLGPSLALGAMRVVQTHMPGWTWMTLGALSGLALYSVATLACARIKSYYPSTGVDSARVLFESSSRWRTGAREHQHVSVAAARRRCTNSHPSSGDASPGAALAPPYTLSARPSAAWLTAKAHMAAADNILRKMLLAIPDDDPDAEGLHSFADLLRPLNDEEVPPAFKLPGGLPSFASQELMWLPYSVRVGPPRTTWLPRLPPQPQPPAGFAPQSLRDLLEPHWFDGLCLWYERLGSWLLDLAEASDAHSTALALELVLARRPKVFVVPASGFVEPARGIIWDLRRGAPFPVDFHLPLKTHLNLVLVRTWMDAHPDFPDRELFSHLLEGVRFKTPPATQLVLQPHLSSLSHGFVSVHRELVRLTEKGFFESFTHPPYAPWITLPMGVAFRKLEPDRPRRTTDGGAPRKGIGTSPFLVDSDGVRVLPLNLLARHPPDDVARGTSSLFSESWKARLAAGRRHQPPLAHAAAHSRPRPGRTPASDSAPAPRVLILFSGPHLHAHTLTQRLAALDFEVRAVDRVIGGPADDLACADVARGHIDDIARGAYAFLFIAPPCSSYSVAVNDSRPQLRSRRQPRGTLPAPDQWQAYLHMHNALADVTINCILAAEASSTPWAIENPAPRWDAQSPAHWARFADWGTLWDILMAAGIAPARLLPRTAAAQAKQVLEATFAACAFGASYQKYTTVWTSHTSSALTARLRGHACTHPATRHPAVLQGRRPDGSSVSADAAAYTPLLACALADGIDDVVHTASVAVDLALRVHPTSPSRPTVSSRPAPPALRAGLLVDVDITRGGSTPTLANPFKLGETGKDERLRQLAVVTYHDWLEVRTVSAHDMQSALPVASAMSHLTGDNVLAEINRLIERYGRDSTFHLVCGRRCLGRLCHGTVLATLFEQVIESSEALPFPKELKPTVPEIMSDLAVLMHLATISGIPVYQIVSDVKDFFNQHHLAPEETHKVGLVTLDPRAIVKHAGRLRAAHPELANIAESVLGYGLTPASNICQRTAHLLTFVWLVEMQLAAYATVLALRRRHPVIRHWLDTRARHLEPRVASPASYRAIRYAQARLWVVSMYTDDGHQAILGPELTIIGLRTWRRIMGELRLTMAIVQKHGLGQQVTVQGCRFNTGLGVVFVPEDKLRRAVAEIDAATNAVVCLRDYHSLVSFLHSLTFVVGMSRSASYGLFSPLMGRPLDPDAHLHLSDHVKEQLRAWRSRLLHCAGAPLHAAATLSEGGLAPVSPVMAPAVFYLRSDASKDGARLPGLGGALGALLWRYPADAPLSTAELSLPIAVLEFAAYYGTVEAFAAFIDADALVVSEVDALATADALSSEAARSPLMQHVHARLLQLPAFQKLDGRHAVGHVFGEANVMADAASRGNYDTARALAAQLGMALQWQQHGLLLPVLMRQLVALHASPPRPQPALADTSRGRHNLNMTGTPIAHRSEAIDTSDLELSLTLLTPLAWSAPALTGGSAPLPFEYPPTVATPVLPHFHVLAPPLQSTFLLPELSGLPQHPSSDRTAAATIAELLRLDSSELALRPTSFDLRDLCADLYDPSSAQPARTSSGQNSAWKHWAAWCVVNNTSPWRLTRHSTDTDYHREAVLQAGFVRFCHTRQSASPRNGRRAALVSSALKTLCHIRKMHRDRNFPMCPSPLVTSQVRRLMFEYKAAFGVADFVPKRKEPFTRYILVDILLATPDGFDTNVGKLQWRSRFGRSLRALIATLAQAGFRKGEVSVARAGAPCDANCLSRAGLSWMLRGRAYAAGDAPAALLLDLQVGDFAVLIPCPSKSDPFDMVWGGDPIWLPYQPLEPLCACAALAVVDRLDPVPPGVDRHAVALFTTDAGTPFSDAQLDRLLHALLCRALPPASAKLYSWHSARIFLATALLASGATHPEIQALCRWQTTDSIKIYARLTSAYYSRLLDGAMTARVSTARAQNLALAVPFIDVQDIRRATAAAPRPDAAAWQADYAADMHVHPDDDADADDPDACRDPLVAAAPRDRECAPRPRPPRPTSEGDAPPTTPCAVARAARMRASPASSARTTVTSARRVRARGGPAVAVPPACPATSVAHLAFRFPASLSGYVTYDGRPSSRRPPVPRVRDAPPPPRASSVSA